MNSASNQAASDQQTFLDEPCIVRRSSGSGRLMEISNTLASGAAVEFSVALVGITFEGGNAAWGSGLPAAAGYGGAFITPVYSQVPASGTPRLHIKAEYCHFLNNKAYYRGGVGYIGCTTDVIVDHCEFASNAQTPSADLTSGGGVFYLDNSATLLATASSFTFNTAKVRAARVSWLAGFS